MITIYLKDVPGASWGISAKIGRDMFFFPGPEPGSPSAGSSEPISFENMGTFDFMAIGLSTGQEFDFFNLELADGEYEISPATGKLTLKKEGAHMFNVGDTVRISTVPFSPDIRIPPGWEGETATIIGGPGDAGGGMQIWKVRGVSGAETWVHEANITPTIPVATTIPWLPLALVGGGALAVIALARNRRR